MSSCSTSAIIARAVSGHHLLKIDGYSQTKVVTNGRDIKSCTFHVRGHAWRIRYYPKEIEDCDFTDLMWKKEGTYVTFEVRGETFTAHRLVLAARSPILKAAAEAKLLGMPERGKNKMPMAVIRIEDMEEKVFKALLHYIYTNAFPDEMDNGDGAATAMARGLLEAADRYKMERLKLICEDMLCKHVSTSMAITTLLSAEQHHCQRLKAACIDFLVSPKNMKVVLENGGFKHLQRSCPSVRMDLIERANVD